METNGIPFWKASACGNDFLIIEGQFAPAGIEEFTHRICDRNNGVGADGVEWIDGAPAAKNDFDLRIRLINADGSPAEISGNGTRCVAAWHIARHGGREVRIATDAGIKHCELTACSGSEFSFRTGMGMPEVGAPLTVVAQGKPVQGIPVSMGNPHFVIFVDRFPGDWQRMAREVQPLAEHFPQGVNVEFVQVQAGDAIAIRIFERGAGETMSSGTGSSACAAAAIAEKHLAHRLHVHAPGGSQLVEWAVGAELYLSGPARLICRGEFFHQK
jgi:diaminopimelate epimerase